MRTLKLMTDYQCYPLWEASPGEVGNIDPNLLPLSTSLQAQLLDWADVYDKTLNWEDPATSGFASVDAVDEFKAQGMRLADRLREELGPEFAVEVKLLAFVKTGTV
jgi:hypothetical protein